MKKFFTGSYRLFQIDTETFEVSKAGESASTGIDYAYLMPSDGEFVSGSGDCTSVKEGDMVLVLYPVDRNSVDGEREIIVLSKDSQYGNYLNRILARDKAEREKQVAKNQELGGCNECCGTCTND